jgi:hypothetical protein
MRPSGRIGERSIALFMLGLVAFMPPVTWIFGAEAALFGVPSLPIYLFAAWGLLIALVAALSETDAAPSKPPATDVAKPDN